MSVRFRWPWAVVGVVAAAVAAGCPGPGSGQCNAGPNGQVDCSDPACAAAAVCQDAGTYIDAGYLCQPLIRNVHCGGPCGLQKDCVQQSWSVDTPLLQCLHNEPTNRNICTGLAVAIQVGLEVDTSAFQGAGVPFGTLNTRFVQKKAIDGTAVTCAVLRGAAPNNDAGYGDQLEASGKFNLLGYDVTRIQGVSPGSLVRVPFVNVGTGSDFLLWSEIWTLPPDSNTQLPTGQRIGKLCVESGAAVAPFTQADHCAYPDAGPGCRTVRVSMPYP